MRVREYYEEQDMLARQREDAMMRMLAQALKPELDAAAVRAGWHQAGALLFLFNIPPFYGTVIKTKHGMPWQWFIEVNLPAAPTRPYIDFTAPEGTAMTVAAAQHAIENLIATLLHLHSYEGP